MQRQEFWLATANEQVSSDWKQEQEITEFRSEATKWEKKVAAVFQCWSCWIKRFQNLTISSIS